MTQKTQHFGTFRRLFFEAYRHQSQFEVEVLAALGELEAQLFARADIPDHPQVLELKRDIAIINSRYTRLRQSLYVTHAKVAVAEARIKYRMLDQVDKEQEAYDAYQNWYAAKKDFTKSFSRLRAKWEKLHSHKWDETG